MTAEILEGWAPILRGVELRTGSRGVFRVSCDGKVVFDKAEVGRRPRPGEVVELLEPLLGSPLTWRRKRAG